MFNTGRPRQRDAREISFQTVMEFPVGKTAGIHPLVGLARRKIAMGTGKALQRTVK
jgi:hypothetical protein